MLTQEAVQKIAQLGVEAEAAEFHQEHGLTYLVFKGSASALLQPLTPALQVRTLAAAVDYLVANRDELDLTTLTVVVSAARVEVLGPARGDGRRQCYLAAIEPDVSATFSSFLNRFMSIEDFVVGAQQRFRAGGMLAEVLAVVGNITQNDVRAVADDGVSQDVTVKAGLVKVATTTLPNPVLLIPRRSFPEVELAPVPFVLRVKRGEQLPQVGLFEADGGAWLVDAAEKVGRKVTDLWGSFEGNSIDDIPFGILA